MEQEPGPGLEPEPGQQGRGYLEYLALPPGACASAGIAERDTIGLGQRTAHSIGDARQRPDLSLRTSGFQLFDALPPTPSSSECGRSRNSGMRAYQRSIEEFVRTKLQDPNHFTLGPGEKLGLVMSYNYAVRSSDRRAVRASSDVIRYVHTDFTQCSGPKVLRHLLTHVACWPTAPNGEQGEQPAHPAGLSAEGYADEVLSGQRNCRYLFLNVWRSNDTQAPIRNWPLALCDPRSWSMQGTDHVLQHSKQAGTNFPSNYLMVSGSEGCARCVSLTSWWSPH
jgi:hypothetical protein